MRPFRARHMIADGVLGFTHLHTLGKQSEMSGG